MKFPRISTILIDEWPEQENYGQVEICLFTRPVIPSSDLRAWKGRIYSSSHIILFFLRLEKRINKDKCFVLPPVWQVAKEGMPSARVECIPNGEPFASILLLIHIIDGLEEKRVLYAGTYFECNDILPHPLISNQTIDELYLDNLTAGSKLPSQISETCERIRKIRTVIPEHTLYIWMHLCGYEALLLRLARHYNFKIQLEETYKTWFHLDEYRNLFEYSGDPDIIVLPYEQNLQFSREFYQESVAEGNFHIKLIEATNFTPGGALDDGLITLAYSRHPDSTEIKKLLNATQPKRIHPLYPVRSADDYGKMIQSKWLPDQCKLVQNVCETEFTEVTSTQRDSQEDVVNSGFTLSESSHETDALNDIEDVQLDCVESMEIGNGEGIQVGSANETTDRQSEHDLYIQLAQDAPQNCGYSYDAYASSSPMASRVTVPKRAKPSARLISLEAELKQEPATSVVQLVVANTGPVIISDSDDSD